MKVNKMIGRSEKSHSGANLPSSMVKKIFEFFIDNDHESMTFEELMVILNVPSKYRRSFLKHLKDLSRKGIIVKLKRKRFAVNKNLSLATGTISFFRNGSATVRKTDTNNHVMIHRRKTGPAFAGDEVLVLINKNGHRSSCRDSVEGEVIRVIKRNCSTIVGILRKRGSFYFVEPQRSDISGNVMIKEPGNAKLGERIVVRLLNSNDVNVFPSGEVIDIIGPSAEPMLDTLSVIRSYDFRTTFPADVIQQAEAVSIKESDLKNRVDLRQKTVFTIDPERAKDFDDAISLEQINHNQWTLGGSYR